MTLFKTIDELLEVLPNAGNLQIEKLQPYLEEIADSVLVPHISQELYDRILDKYNSDNPTFNDPEKALLRRLRLIGSKLALAAYLPMGEVLIGDAGITTVGKGPDRTAAYDQQITRLTESLTSQAYDSIEKLLTWLQLPVNMTEFTQYASSEAYTRQQRGLIRGATDFSDIYPIGGSRLTFQAIHPELLNVEEDKLIPLIGRPSYNIILGSSLSDDYASLRRAAQKAVTFQAVANIIPLQQSIQLDAAGLRVYQMTQSGSQNVKFYRSPTEAERKAAVAAAQARADFYWDQVSSLISEITNPGGLDFEPEFLTTGKMAMF